VSGEPTVVGGGTGGPGSEGPAAAELDERVVSEAVSRGLITPPQGRSALEEARGGGVPVLDVLRRRGMLDEQAAKDLDEETREDFVPGFRVLDRIGEGGMGVVYRALQKRLDRVVALKVVIPQLAGDPSYLKRFEREAKAVAKLNHPNIVAAYDYGESRGRVFFAMEFVEGTNCAEDVRRRGPMTEARGLDIVREVAAGLAHAAAAGIIHRDIKPANILLAARGPGETGSGTLAGAKITDLGLARTGGAGSSDLTAAGTILGTPGYMAPEQAFGGEVDFRADIYALGATLYQFLTGQRPFDASTPVGVIARQQVERLPDPRETRPGLSAGLVGLLHGMMARKPGNRYGSYRELLRDIDRVREGGMPERPLPPPEARSFADPTGPVPAASPSAATVLVPSSASAAPAAPSSPGVPGGPAPPRRSRAGLVASVALVAAAGVGAAIYVSKGRGKEEAPAGGGTGGLPTAKAPGETSAPTPPIAPGGAPPSEPERAADAVEAAVARGDLDGGLDRLDAMRQKMEALPTEDRNRAGPRLQRVRQAERRLRDMAGEKVRELWEKGEYEAARRRLREVAARLPGEESKAALAPYEQKLAEAVKRGPAERQSLVAARSAAKRGDPLEVLANLEDFESKYGDFSPSVEEARGLAAEARRAAPEVVLESEPRGAAVLVRAREVGTTPLQRRFPAGDLAFELRREGFKPLARTVQVRAGEDGQRFPFRLEPLPPPDPVPARLLKPAGDPSPLWNGNLGPWKLVGAWRLAEPERRCILGGEEKPEPAGSLRGSRASALASAERALPPAFREAAGWKIEWQMIGERARGGSTARVELHFAEGPGGTQLALGIDDEGAYLGRRDLASGSLERTHGDARAKAGAPHSLVVENHGGVFLASVDGRPLGAVKGADPAPGRPFLRLTVEDGAGYFSDLQAWKME